jgi:hypothetical protein
LRFRRRRLRRRSRFGQREWRGFSVRRRRCGWRRHVGGGSLLRSRLGRLIRHRHGLLKHQFDRRFIRKGRRQRRRHGEHKRPGRGGVDQQRYQYETKLPPRRGGKPDAAPSGHARGHGAVRAGQGLRPTPFSNVITYRHRRLSPVRGPFGKSRPAFPPPAFPPPAFPPPAFPPLSGYGTIAP